MDSFETQKRTLQNITNQNSNNSDLLIKKTNVTTPIPLDELCLNKSRIIGDTGIVLTDGNVIVPDLINLTKDRLMPIEIQHVFTGIFSIPEQNLPFIDFQNSFSPVEETQIVPAVEFLNDSDYERRNWIRVTGDGNVIWNGYDPPQYLPYDGFVYRPQSDFLITQDKIDNYAIGTSHTREAWITTVNWTGGLNEPDEIPKRVRNGVLFAFLSQPYDVVDSGYTYEGGNKRYNFKQLVGSVYDANISFFYTRYPDGNFTAVSGTSISVVGVERQTTWTSGSDSVLTQTSNVAKTLDIATEVYTLTMFGKKTAYHPEITLTQHPFKAILKNRVFSAPTDDTNILISQLDCGMAINDNLTFSSTIRLPIGIYPNTIYKVKTVSSTSFTISATAGGPAVEILKNSGEGIHTFTLTKQRNFNCDDDDIITTELEHHMLPNDEFIKLAAGAPSELVVDRTYYVKTILSSSSFNISTIVDGKFLIIDSEYWTGLQISYNGVYGSAITDIIAEQQNTYYPYYDTGHRFLFSVANPNNSNQAERPVLQAKPIKNIYTNLPYTEIIFVVNTPPHPVQLSEEQTPKWISSSNTNHQSIVPFWIKLSKSTDKIEVWGSRFIITAISMVPASIQTDAHPLYNIETFVHDSTHTNYVLLSSSYDTHTRTTWTLPPALPLNIRSIAKARSPLTWIKTQKSTKETS